MKNKNQLSQKLEAENIITAEFTAKVAGVSASLVKGVRSGQRNATKGAGLKAAITDDLLKTGVNALITDVPLRVNALIAEVERIIKFK